MPWSRSPSCRGATGRTCACTHRTFWHIARGAPFSSLGRYVCSPCSDVQDRMCELGVLERELAQTSGGSRGRRVCSDRRPSQSRFYAPIDLRAHSPVLARQCKLAFSAREWSSAVADSAVDLEPVCAMCQARPWSSSPVGARARMMAEQVSNSNPCSSLCAHGCVSITVSYVSRVHEGLLKRVPTHTSLIITGR